MRRLALTSLCFLFVLGVTGCAGKSDSARVGAYADVRRDDPGVIAAARFAVDEQNKTAGAVALVKILSAQRQVVAGYNYKLRLQVDSDGRRKQAEVVVYKNLHGAYTLTSWTWQ